MTVRLVADGSPFRQSGSHASPLSSLEASTRKLQGYAVIRLSKGQHRVSAFWRMWGQDVRSWTVSSSLYDGFVGGGSLVVHSGFRYLWYTQPLSIARLTGSALVTHGTKVPVSQWMTAKGMKLSFSTPRAWPLRLIYSMQVRPQVAPGTGGLEQRSRFHSDTIAVRWKKLPRVQCCDFFDHKSIWEQRV